MDRQTRMGISKWVALDGNVIFFFYSKTFSTCSMDRSGIRVERLCTAMTHRTGLNGTIFWAREALNHLHYARSTNQTWPIAGVLHNPFDRLTTFSKPVEKDKNHLKKVMNERSTSGFFQLQYHFYFLFLHIT